MAPPLARVRVSDAAAAPAEATPLAALDADVVPAPLHFVRSHHPTPALDPAAFQLVVGGAVGRPRAWTLAALQERASPVTRHVLLECAGHRRTELEPVPDGLPWGLGAVSHARWTGIPLVHLLDDAGLADDVCEIVFEGADRGPFDGVPGIVGEHPFARSLPLADARGDGVLLAWAMNDAPLRPEHGGPLRLVVPGWYGMASVKWLVGIEAATIPFEGVFQALDYHLIAPGGDAPGTPITRMRVSSLLTSPEAGAVLPAGAVEVRGIAWGGDDGVAAVDVRSDDGPWRAALLEVGESADAPTRFRAAVELPVGEHELQVRATDGAGNRQPERPTPNVRGYVVDAVQRLRVSARAAPSG